MSDQFSYSGDNSIIIQDGSIIWNDQSHDQSSLQYMDANDTIISDSTINESYVTAVDSNETQYFSILEHSNDIRLEDLHNLTIGNAGAQENIVFTEDATPVVDEETTNENEDEGSQVVVFTIDGSDDLYGVQFTQDEEGNTQKYQFKFRTTPNGQLEAIPETIELLPNDDQEITETENEQGEVEQLQQDEPQQYFLVQTEVGSENVNNQLDQEDQQLEAPEKEVEVHHEHGLIKGERQSPVEFERCRETENTAHELPEDNIENFVDEEGHSETIENIDIKSEVLDRTVLEQNNVSYVSHMANVKQEHFTEELDECQEEQELDETIQPQGDIEEIVQTCSIKQQLQEAQSEEETEHDQNEITISQHEEDLTEKVDEANIETTVHSPLNQEDLVQQFIHENCQIEVEFQAEPEQQERPQEYQVKETYNVHESQQEYSDNYMEDPNLNANHDSDSEQYEIVEGLHVTGEINDEPQEQIVTTTGAEPVLHEVIERYQEQNIERTNILKHPVVNTNKDQKSKKPFVSVKYYVVYPEKENVNSLADNAPSQLPVSKSMRPNPRSVLRTSFVKPRKPDKDEKMRTNSPPECDLFHKRFAKNKEAMRAKLFHNFLNRTTIPHAPVRQQRQPRKQEIKPVTERGDEEIIVQEVMVSSNAFIESLNQKMKNKLQVTAVVELSDSEDECYVKVNRHCRKTHQIPRQTSESDLSVIEIHSDEESHISKNNNIENIVKRGKGRPKKSNTESEAITLKRRRGRPPKKSKLPLEDTPTDLELSPSKRNRTHCEVVQPDKGSGVLGKSEINIDKLEIACPKCPKTFPSKNSLNTHIYHHNLENRLKNKDRMSRPSFIPRQSTLPKIEYSHKCLSCQEVFKNSILLQRHNCTRKQTALTCSVCLKQFRDIAMLNIHKKTHIKSNLITNTSIAKISPGKSLYRSSTSLVKSPKTKSIKPVLTNIFKCKQCSKVCDSEQSLATHTKMHKKFLCSSCSATFSSRFLLDTHVRTNCVKIKSPTNKRLSFKIKRSFIHTPPKRMSVCKPNETRCNITLNQSVVSNTTLNQSVSSFKLECEVCNMKFSTFRAVYTHKVQKHGLNTPDKSLLQNPKRGIYKPRAAHGGIPTNDRMKKAYAALREKLAEMQDENNVAQ